MTAASLAMYDLLEVHWATDALWQGLARAFRAEGLAEVPDSLTRHGAEAETWLAPDLLFSQTCGYPLTHALAGRVTLLATPRYDAPGCLGSDYCSLIVVRRDAPTRDLAGLAGARVAVNSWDSHSGMNALRTMIAPLATAGSFFSEVLISGGHRASLRLVAEGKAEVAAVDAVTHALLAAHASQELAALRVLAHSPMAPGLPFITAGDASPDRIARLRAGLAAAFADPALQAARAALLLTGHDLRPLEDYRLCRAWEVAAADAGYPRIA